MQIAISGVGIVSSLGIGADATLDAIARSTSGLAPAARFLATRHRVPVGEVPHSNETLSALLGLAPQACPSRTALLGMVAAREALLDAGDGTGLRTGLVSATSVGGMDRTEEFYADYLRDPSHGRLRDVVMHDCSASTRAIARYCAIDGLATTVSTACSSAANAILTGARLIRHRIADRIVVGGTDALSRFTLGGFRSLMILDEQPCRPFDASRAGLNLGEGAGYLVLQRADTLRREPYGYLTGSANANDAHHQTASSADGEGAYLAMSGALAAARIAPEQVDYINAHGTGTPNNDLTEGRAIRRLFGDRVPPFSSTKGFTGHTLAAAGGIEAVLCALALRDGLVYPNLRFEQPISEHGLVPERQLQSGRPIRHVLSNSFGFGGNCTSLLFSKP